MWWEVIAKKNRRARVEPDCAFVLEYDANLEETKTIRNDFILVRRTRPMVPAPMSSPMPSKVPVGLADRAARKEREARLHNVYMRPWTLLHQYATDAVPCLARLQKVPGAVGRRRTGKQSNDDRSYAAAWRWFLRGNVLSEHQRRIITAFLALNCATSTTDLGDTLEEKPAKTASQP